MDGLRNDVVTTDHRIREWIPVERVTVREAVLHALAEARRIGAVARFTGPSVPHMDFQEIIDMDSINRRQQEETREDLRADDAVTKIQELVGKAQTCFFCTTASRGGSSGARPMSVREVDDEGNLWFLSADDSHKNKELTADPRVELYFQGSPHSDFLHLSGTATISTDKKRIKELWKPIIRTWFTGGVDDSRITVIKVTPRGGYYWDTKHGKVVAGIKMLIGSVLRKTMDDSVEGKVLV